MNNYFKITDFSNIYTSWVHKILWKGCACMKLEVSANFIRALTILVLALSLLK